MLHNRSKESRKTFWELGFLLGIVASTVVIPVHSSGRWTAIAFKQHRNVVATISVRNAYLDAFICELRGGDESDDRQSDVNVAVPDVADGVIDTVTSALTGAAIRILRVITRTLAALFEDDEDVHETRNPISLVGICTRKCRRIIIALFSPTFSTLDSSGSQGEESSDSEAEYTSLEEKTDFGAYLSNSYDVDATRNSFAKASPILGGNLVPALRFARYQCRMLVILIPSSLPKKRSGATGDTKAVASFLSEEVAAIAEKRPRKASEGGSFLLWSTKVDSPEAHAALKYLKPHQGDGRRRKQPLLLVVYPAQVIDGRGQPQILPKIVAQHHCTPPPSPEAMASWLNALRKRHAKQYGSMQLQAKEAQYFKERQEGYHQSMKSDTERKEKEAREEAERLAKEQAEKAHMEAIARRREDLRASLPQEPEGGGIDVKTISLRLADGRSATRRFLGDAHVADIFNWMDVTFEIERESVNLTTMNGKQTYDWDSSEKLLSDCSFSKMTGLRVVPRRTAVDGQEIPS